MKPLEAWSMADAPFRGQHEMGRKGRPTLKIDGVYLHSRYDPEQEAERLIESARLAPDRPVLVVGLGLGYHVAALLQHGFEVAVYEPDPSLAPLALVQFPVLDKIPAWLGALDDIDASDAFKALARKKVQLLEHPPSLKVHPDCGPALKAALSRAAFAKQRLNIAVTGPLYGGSLPIAGYLADAFRRLGHNTLLVENDKAWPLYESMTKGVRNHQASAQLGNLFGNVLAEWTYARVAEFDPEICIVLAQSPVSQNLAARLAARGTVTAFWFVENWRHLSYWRELAPRYDCFFHMQPGLFEEQLEAIGCKHHAYVQTACDPIRHRPVELKDEERSEFQCDISFAGAGYYNRLQLFRGLTDYDFKIWGVDWHERELAGKVVGGERRFDSETFMKIVAGSKINLNLHASTAHDGVDPDCDAINPRIFEIAAAGGFQVCDPCIGLEKCFDFETEIPTYRSLTELRQRIDYFLAHDDERRAIAAAAQKRALAEHTYEHRAQQMLDILLKIHGDRILKRGVRVQRHIGEVLDDLKEDSSLAQWLKQLPQDHPFTLDGLQQCVQADPLLRSEGEQIFCYMREVFSFAETLLKDPR